MQITLLGLPLTLTPEPVAAHTGSEVKVTLSGVITRAADGSTEDLGTLTSGFVVLTPAQRTYLESQGMVFAPPA
jgi:hypothetical protein